MAIGIQPELRLRVLGCWGSSLGGPTSSFSLELPGLQILLDVGCDPVSRLASHHLLPSAVSIAFISHMHSDHVSGLASLAFCRMLESREDSSLTMPLIVAAHLDILPSVRQLVRLQYSERDLPIDWIEISENDECELAPGISARLVESVHTVPCYGLVLSGPGVKVAYTSDSAPSPRHVDIMRSSDVLIGEAFGLAGELGQDIHERGHSTAEDLHALAVDVAPKYVIPFHFGPEYRDPAMRRRLVDACAGGASLAVMDPVDQTMLVL